MRLLVVTSTAIILLSVSTAASAQQRMQSYALPGWLLEDTSSICVRPTPRAARELREMYLRSYNEYKERAACLFGTITPLGGGTLISIMRVEEAADVVADSVSLRAHSGRICPVHREVIGRAHTHITGVFRTNFDFSDTDERSFAQHNYNVDILVWGVTRETTNITWHFRSKKGLLHYPTNAYCRLFKEEYE